jgi:hypothetical protein
LTPDERIAFYLPAAIPTWCIEGKKWPFDISDTPRRRPQMPKGAVMVTPVDSK